MDRAEFKRQLGGLQQVVFYGSNYYIIWKALWPTEEVVGVINSHRGFFAPVANALRGMTVIEFSKVFDGDDRTVSLTRLLAAARRDREALVPHVSVEELRTMAKQLAASADLRVKLKRLRDQYVAHLDVSPSGDTTLPVGEIDALLTGIQMMFNTLSVGHDRSSTAYSFQENDSLRSTGYVLGALVKEAEWRKTAPSEESARYYREVWEWIAAARLGEVAVDA